MRHFTFAAAAAALTMICNTALADTNLGKMDDQQFENRLIRFFSKLNTMSFKNNREYCGYLGFDESENVIASDATKGNIDNCMSDEPAENLVLFSSYHSHGAFDPDAFSEVPSSTDINGDHEEGVDGYVTTPGGRIWYIDGEAMTAQELCSIGCLPKDPAFEPGLIGPIKKTYTLRQILNLENES